MKKHKDIIKLKVNVNDINFEESGNADIRLNCESLDREKEAFYNAMFDLRK